MALLDQLFGGLNWDDAGLSDLLRKLSQNQATVSTPDRGEVPASASKKPALRPEPIPADNNDTGFFDALSALGRGYARGGLIGAIGDAGMVGRERQNENETVQWLLGRDKNLDPNQARMIARNPQLMQQILASRLGPKAAPTIVKIAGPYGTEVEMFWNQNTNKLEPVSNLMAGNERTAPSTPEPPAPTPQPAAPQVGTTPPVPSEVTDPPPAARWATLPSAPGPTVTTQPTMPAPTGDFTVGRAVPKPPEGYVHKLAPGGIGYLWHRNGTPVFETKAEAEARGKRTDEAEKVQDDESRVAQQFLGGLEQLGRFPTEFGRQAFERAVGPMQASDPNPETAGGIQGSGISVPAAGRMISRAWTDIRSAVEGGAGGSEVRDRIETATKNLAAVMKPLIRKPGEGAWSDKDQANLEAQLGNLTRARTQEEFNRRLNDIRQNISKIFLIQPSAPQAQPRSPDAPATAEEEMTWLERLIGRQL